MTWQGKTVMVTGAQGFIGSWLTEALLDDGAEVVAITRDTPAHSRFHLEEIDSRCTLVWAEFIDSQELVRALNEHDVTPRTDRRHRQLLHARVARAREERLSVQKTEPPRSR